MHHRLVLPDHVTCGTITESSIGLDWLIQLIGRVGQIGHRDSLIIVIRAHFDHIIEAKKILDSALLVVLMVQLGDVFVFKLLLERVKCALVQRADLDLESWDRLLAQFSYLGLTLIVVIFNVKEHAEDFFSDLGLLDA